MRKIIALLTMWLIVMLPVVEASSGPVVFDMQGPPITTSPALFLTATIPSVARSAQIDISGRTLVNATLTITVNNADVRRDRVTREDFLFRNVPLSVGLNSIIVTATLGNESVRQSGSTEVDTQPPLMNVSVPELSLSATTIANISVSEQVNLTIRARKPAGTTFPFPTDLKVDSATAQSVKLSWAAVPDALEYAIYRDGIRIATTSALSYQDSSVASNTRYEYQVSAVSVACIESDPTIITASTLLSSTNTTVQAPTSVKLSCERSLQRFELRQGTNRITVELLQGENLVTFTAQDRAGNTAVVEKQVVFSTGPPRFVESNLGQLDPSYDQNVKVKGKISTKGSVTAFVNGKPQKTVPTEEDGTFSIPVRLERLVNMTGRPRSSLDTGTQWVNKVYLEAVDNFGLKAKTPESSIRYALCGSGAKIDVFLTSPLPDMLNPRLLLEGIQQIGLGFNYTYRGGYNATILTNQIRVTKLTLSPEFAKEYDNNLVQTSAQVARGRAQRKPSGEGYIQVIFDPISDPWSQLTEKEDAEVPKSPTTFDKESRISDHRKGDCLVPGLGCVKLFLQLEIPFQETSPKLNLDPITRRTIETVKVENHVQRSCVNIEIPVDVRINPKVIPSGFLRRTSDTLGKIIENIDRVLKPIQTIGEYLFYSCVAGTLLSAVPIFMEHYNCEYANIANKVAGRGDFDPNIAAIGKCEDAYDDSSESNCKKCQDWKEKRKKIEYVYRQLCDRTFCPAAPSLQYYMRIKGTQPPVDVEVNGIKGKVGSDCSAWMQTNKKTGTQTRRTPPRLFFTNTEITKIYTDWIDQQNKNDCAGLHSADPKCCGYEYMREWSSACGVSAFGTGVDTFDEIKESACMSAQKANLNSIKISETNSIECNKLLNSVSGFCDKNGGEGPTTIEVMRACCEEGPAPTGLLKDLNLGASKEKQIYILVLPQKAATSSPFGATTGEYDIKLGYLVETIEFERSTTKSTTRFDEQFEISSKLKGIQLPSDRGNNFQRTFFKAEDIEKYYQGKTESSVYENFKDALCKAAGYVKGNCPLDIADAQSIYEEVMSLLGSPDKEYIIRPADGLINSARCICIPTLLGYLKLWRNIMTAVRNCINTILLTGDGDPGVCQAVVSQYACDLLYDAIACFVQKFGSPGVGGRPGFGIGGDIIGALTATGTDLARSVESRYGETSMYKAMFIDRKLVHSICLFAFTGTWNFDLTAAFDGAIDEIPIDSYALLTPCNRRFVSYNPATQPKGLVTWVYHFGVGFAAGADATVELHLKCSGGFKCREVDGFLRGKCDCDRPEEIIIEPEGFPNNIKKGEIINQEIFYTMDGAPGDGQKRWDQAFMVYRWNDGKQNREEKTEPCTITQTGGVGSVPNFCRFDLGTFSFRCQLGDTTAGIRFLKILVEAPHKIPEPVFAVGENINVKLDVKQEYPLPVDFKNDKYLQYIIKNQNGLEVEKNLQHIRLAKDGDYIISTESAFGIAPAVIQSWFTEGTTAAVGKTYDTRTWSSTINPATSSRGDSVISTVGVTPALNEAETLSFILELEGTDIATQEKWTLFTASGAGATAIDPVSGFGGKGAMLKSEVLNSAGGKLVYSPQIQSTVAGTPTTSQFSKTVTIDLASTRTRLSKGEKIQILITMNPSRAENPCANDVEKLKPQRFTITFTSFDADRFGQPSEQISTDPATDLPVQIVQEFYAVCAKGDDIKGMEARIRAKGLNDLLLTLKTIINSINIKEEQAVMQLTEKSDEASSSPDPEPMRAQINTILLEIIAQEEKTKVNLLNIIPGVISAAVNLKDAASRDNLISALTTLQANQLKLIDDLTAHQKNIEALEGKTRSEIDTGITREIESAIRQLKAKKSSETNLLQGLALLKESAFE